MGPAHRDSGGRIHRARRRRRDDRAARPGDRRHPRGLRDSRARVRLGAPLAVQNQGTRRAHRHLHQARTLEDALKRRKACRRWHHHAVAFGIQIEFLIFTALLLGVAIFHRHALTVALLGLAALLVYELTFGRFSGGQPLAGLRAHFAREWVVLANLFVLLLGFALLARHFEHTNIPKALPRMLPGDWQGGFVLLALVFLISGFLDNIAAAIIGGTMAASVYRNRVHIGFLAAIVAAANAGGAGSVIGDTTTTMMWIEGVSPLDVLH